MILLGGKLRIHASRQPRGELQQAEQEFNLLETELCPRQIEVFPVQTELCLPDQKSVSSKLNTGRHELNSIRHRQNSSWDKQNSFRVKQNSVRPI
jgi:hypothetical protein